MEHAGSALPRYGVREQVESTGELGVAVESLQLLGYAVVDAGYSPAQIAAFSDAFDAARHALYEQYGEARLRALDEHNTVRAPMALKPDFLALATNARVLEVCDRLIGGSIILNQQNGVINPPLGERYNQGAFHRDLPYQHYVSSRPLAINALFCLDAFTPENGATIVLPATHKQEALPSDAQARLVSRQVTAPAGSFILIDCMTYHCGGVNQQISLPDLLGESFTRDPVLRRLLGYDFQVPLNLTQYFAGREAARARASTRA